MSETTKTLTQMQIRELAERHGFEYATLRAVIEVEAGGSGFVGNVPKILYEPHIMHRLLTTKGLITIRNKLAAEHPSHCYAKWGTYKYGPVSEQHNRLGKAAVFHRETALESCSWGLGQVMGFHWKNLGYSSLQEFVNAMYRSEADQVEAMIRYIKWAKLSTALKNKQWAVFARGYNGAGFARNKYDVKLAAAYRKYS